MTLRQRPIILATGLAAILMAAYTWTGSRSPDGDILVLYGNVDIREVDMAFRQPGRLNRMTRDEGDTVLAGEVLAELDDTPYRNALAMAQADTRQAQAGLDKLRRGNRQQEIAQAEQAVRQSEAALTLATREFERYGPVVETGASTRQALDQARSQKDQAAAQLASARQALALSREGFRREDITAAEAGLAGAEAALAQAETALSDTRLLAPGQAVVLSRIREPGSMVTPQEPVYTLSLRDPIYIRAYVAEPHLGQATPGTSVTVQTDSSDRIYHGRIGFVSPRAEFTPKSVETTDLRTDLVYRLRIVVSDADDALRQGMPVTVQVSTGSAGH